MTEEITPEVVLEDEDEKKNSSKTLLLSHQAMPDHLYLIPITGRPHLPAQIQPLLVNQRKWEETLKKTSETGHRILGLVFINDENLKNGEITTENFPTMGCAVRILNHAASDGKIQFIAQGLQRFRINRIITKQPPFLAQVEYPDMPDENKEEVRAYAISLINTIKELLPLNPLYNEELKQYLDRFSPEDPSPLADFAAAITTSSGEEIQEILETVPILNRMKKVLLLLKKELEVAKLQNKIQKDVDEKITGSKRRFFLMEQMKAIQQELGISKDDKTADVDLFKDRMDLLKVPDHVQERFDQEIQKLSVLETGSSEYGVTRNYLEWVSSFPWGVFSEDKFDLAEAKKVLNRDHSSLDDVKERIIEFFAAGVYKKDISGSILLFVGPPGVGKTSIGKSIAEALGRKFFRFSLGGMRDEAEIKGHRRTYVGAMPGKFIQALRETKVSNPVIMLDEVDKVGISYQGDPASALLEVLDPEQNSEFLDHYVDLRVDLSKVLFICTANQLDTIPPPLLDRMEMIRLSGYITSEKQEIAKKHLWPRLLKKNSLTRDQLKITDPAIRQIIEGYARESGVRNLEKQLNKIIRKSIVGFLTEDKKEVSINTKNTEEYLGPPVFKKERQIRGVGVVTGLAWTAMGGVTLPVEVIRVPGKGPGIKLTGKLGEVMRESASIALSYITSEMVKFKGDPDLFENGTLHIHVPEGATPKDGPSAGITIATALLSLARGEEIDRPIAMTGELTLTGQVLPVGGVREKIIAARRAGIMELILPFNNKRDADKLPDHIKKGMTFNFAKHYKDVFKFLF